jgi:hypothetical protein
MHLVQLLLPLHDNQRQPFPAEYFNLVRADLTRQFGGVTAFIRAPAVGLWKEGSAPVNRDDVIMFEVIVDNLDRRWWASYRVELQNKFRQEDLLVWACEIIRL